MPTAAKLSITAALVLGGLIAAFSLRSSDSAAEVSWLPRCSLHEFTGLHCPSCGNTRATYALLHGDIAGAFRQNAAFVIALPFLAFGAARVWMACVFPGKLKPLPFRWRYSYSILLIGLVVLFGVLRNLSFKPFVHLAPEPVKKTVEKET